MTTPAPELEQVARELALKFCSVQMMKQISSGLFENEHGEIDHTVKLVPNGPPTVNEKAVAAILAALTAAVASEREQTDLFRRRADRHLEAFTAEQAKVEQFGASYRHLEQQLLTVANAVNDERATVERLRAALAEAANDLEFVARVGTVPSSTVKVLNDSANDARAALQPAEAKP